MCTATVELPPSRSQQNSLMAELTHSLPILMEGPQDMVELTTGHVIFVALYMNAGT